MDSNAAGSSAAGASQEKIADLTSWRTSPRFAPNERAALDLAEAMSRTPAHVSDEVYAEARRHFTDEQMVELAATVAMENYRARFNRVFDVEAQDFYHPT